MEVAAESAGFLVQHSHKRRRNRPSGCARRRWNRLSPAFASRSSWRPEIRSANRRWSGHINVYNILLACAVAIDLGLSDEDQIRKGIDEFADECRDDSNG